MKIFPYPQLSLEWLKFHAGKISGTRFGAILSNRKNRLVYELIDETMNGIMAQDDYMSEEMQYGIDNQSLALEMYSNQTGIKLVEGVTMQSDDNEIHIASADGLSECETIAQEVKCTMNGAIHIQRIFDGVDSNYIPQCINYFAVSPKIKEVHFISYCGLRPERPLHIVRLSRCLFDSQIQRGLRGVGAIADELREKLDKYIF